MFIIGFKIVGYYFTYSAEVRVQTINILVNAANSFIIV